MALRPHRHLIDGELDNTRSGKVTGWMKFVGVSGTVIFDLEGDFHRDVRGAKIRFTGEAFGASAGPDAELYMKGFALHQTGKAGDITAGLPPFDYGPFPYIEWYSEQNGRVVLELESTQVRVIGIPIPADQSEPISRERQHRNLCESLRVQPTAREEQADPKGRKMGR